MGSFLQQISAGVEESLEAQMLTQSRDTSLDQQHTLPLASRVWRTRSTENIENGEDVVGCWKITVSQRSWLTRGI
jgi:hypothetical protein